MELIIVDPGHFHASLLQKEMYPGVAPRVSVYASLGPEVLDYLRRIALFNSRPKAPTHWELDVHLSSDPMQEMLRDRPGNIVILAGRNRGKIDRIVASLRAGLHVLADKPWIISSGDMPKLEAALQIAAGRHLAAYDIMTERYEVTSELQRLFVNDPAVFGSIEPGTLAEPAVRACSVHNVMKMVAGAPLQRPPWFFDIAEYGEGLADVGTHVVDLVQWTLFPGQPVSYDRDIRLLDACRWPLVISQAQFESVTGEKKYPEFLSPYIRSGNLEYFCNNSVHYTIRGIHTKLDIRWNWQAQEGAGDMYEASFRGSRSTVAIRQGKPEDFVPELYVTPGSEALRAAVRAAVERSIAAIEERWPGLSFTESGGDIRIVIPSQFRVGHEAHFAQVTRRFFDFVKDPDSLPACEASGMLAKYYVSTAGVELGHTRAQGQS